MKHVVIGTAGHIDHGKSALVRALTGTDPDRLKEEKERGITIDLGFAFLSKGEEISLGFVDVPGHERFVKNMLAGVGGIDLVMLVVAADESVMPQTREHFEICRLLEVPRGLIVVTKCDLVDSELRELASLEAKELVAGSFLGDAPILPVSARTGEGIEALKATLFELADDVPGRRATGPFRLPVDRAFSMKGFGTVVTGTLIAGSIGQDEEVEILPRGVRARVRGLQAHGQTRRVVSAGQRTAVNLQGVGLDAIARGDAIVRPGTFRSTLMIDASLDVLASSPIAVKDLTRVHLHLGTAQVLARVRVLGGKKAIAPGEAGFVQLRLELPVVAARGDRFILRRYSPLETIAGGLVLDSSPEKHSVSSTEVAARLEVLASSDAVRTAALFVSELGEAGMAENDLARRLGVAPGEAEPVVSALLESSDVVLVSESPRTFVSSSALDELAKSAVDQVRRFQHSHPLSSGMPKSELREKVASRAPLEVFERLLRRLAGEGKLRMEKDLVATADHRIQMSDEEGEVRDFLVDRYRRLGYRPKSLAELSAESKRDVELLERIQRVLLKEGTLVRVAEGMVFHREALDQLKSSIRDHKEKRERIDVAFFKDMIGVTRKHAIPLLEWLDRERVTRRSGNERIIL